MEVLLANRSLVVMATVAVASTMGLTSVISLLKPGNNSISLVSISESLPLPEKIGDMYEWFDGFVEMVDWVELTNVSPSSIGALRNLIEAVQRLERSLDSAEPLVGRKALEALDCLIDGIDQASLRVEDALLRVLTPSQALGCDADLVILTGTSSTAWPVSSPSVPWMELSDRLALGVERPDSPMRSARHLIRHVLHAAKEVVVMDTSITESNPAGTHWAEVLDEAGQEIEDEVENNDDM